MERSCPGAPALLSHCSLDPTESHPPSLRSGVLWTPVTLVTLLLLIIAIMMHILKEKRAGRVMIPQPQGGDLLFRSAAQGGSWWLSSACPSLSHPVRVPCSCPRPGAAAVSAPRRRQAPVLKSESCSCMWPYLGPSENTEVPWGLPAFYPEAPGLSPCSWLDFFQGEHF